PAKHRDPALLRPAKLAVARLDQRRHGFPGILSPRSTREESPMDATRSAMESRYPRAVQLKDGTTVSLRLVSRADADRIVAFARELPPDDLLFLGIDITDPGAVPPWLESADDGRAIVVVTESGAAMARYGPPLDTHVTSP